MDSTDNVVSGDIELDHRPFLIKYRDGRIQRCLRSPFVATSENPTGNHGVSTRDVVIDAATGLSVRLFLPSRAAAMAGSRRLPLVVYFHGGCFCTESTFCRTYHRYATSLAASAAAVLVSVEYRLAPEHPIPAAYDDAWTALHWVASLADPWLAEHADPRRTFLAGDSAGGNIVYHTAVRASRDGNIDVEGIVMVHPYFWGAERLPAETVWDGMAVLPANWVDILWPFVTAGKAGNDDPRMNPPDEEISLLTCRRVLVAVAEKDTLRDRGRRMLARIRDCGGNVTMTTLVESEGEDHGFHLYSPLRATSKRLMQSIVEFINQPPTELSRMSARESEIIEALTPHPITGVPARPFRDPFGYGMGFRQQTCMAHGTSKIGRGKSSNKSRSGLFITGPAVSKTNKVYKAPSAAARPGSHAVIMNFL